MELSKGNDPGSSGFTRTRSPSTSSTTSTTSDLSDTNPFGTPTTESDFKLAALRQQVLRDQAAARAAEARDRTPTKAAPTTRGRKRSNSFSGTNPLDTPITAADFQLAAHRKNLQREIDQDRRVEQQKQQVASQATRSYPQTYLPTAIESPYAACPSTRPTLSTVSEHPLPVLPSSRPPLPTISESPLAAPYASRPLPTTPDTSYKRGHRRSQASVTAADVQGAGIEEHDIPESTWQGVVTDFINFSLNYPHLHVVHRGNELHVTNHRTGERSLLRKITSESNVLPPDTPKIGATKTFKHSGRPQPPPGSNPPNLCHPNLSPSSSSVPNTGRMNYQNYIDSPGGPGTNPRQAPPSPSQAMNHPNGMNGGMGMGGMVGYPTPAGHQQDLNYIMSMVEELSGVLRKNQDLTSGLVEKVGSVREMAARKGMTNDQIVDAVAAELNCKLQESLFSRNNLTHVIADSRNLEMEISVLRKALDKAEYDKAENWKLACHGANILADLTEKMHRFRERTDADILAWHKNYRQQLATEREENLNLRNQINDMRAAACRANGHLRDMRRYIDDHDEWNELRVANIALRQEKRFWKRMAMPLLADDDSEFSDDDDLIDPEVCRKVLVTDNNTD